MNRLLQVAYLSVKFEEAKLAAGSKAVDSRLSLSLRASVASRCVAPKRGALALRSSERSPFPPFHLHGGRPPAAASRRTVSRAVGLAASESSISLVSMKLNLIKAFFLGRWITGWVPGCILKDNWQYWVSCCFDNWPSIEPFLGFCLPVTLVLFIRASRSTSFCNHFSYLIFKNACILKVSKLRKITTFNVWTDYCLGRFEVGFSWKKSKSRLDLCSM